MRFRWDRHGKTGVVGCALVIAALSACSGKSDGNDEAGSGGSSATTGGSTSGGRSTTPGASGSATGGKGQGSGGSGTGGTAAGASSTGGDSASGGRAAQPGGSPNGGSRPSEGGASDGGNSAAGAGESSSAGEGSGSAGSAGSAGSGGGPGRPVWCPELESCGFGADQRLAVGEACPDDRDCYDDVWCGESIQCVEYEDDAGCTDKPACDAGQLTSALCSGLGICETRSACGKSVICETYPPSGSECQPGLQKDRRFAAPPEKCASISISCPEGSSSFVDEMCGCGCEQPEDCPDSVNCQPTSGDPRSALCNSDECPFTQRAH